VTSAASRDTLQVQGHISLFGFEPSDATAHLRARPRSWRVGGAIRLSATGVVLAPLLGLIPPHAPWIVGSVGVGAILARRRWKERFTLESVDGACPRCQAAVSVRPGRLRSPHPVTCEGCHHEGSLRLFPYELDTLALE
jgi:hypothetical protein